MKTVRQRPFSEYPSLYDNKVESATFEIRKVVNYPIEHIFYVQDKNIFVVKSRNYLWKINASGHVVDKWDSGDCMFSSGYCFAKNYYVDWIFSGDKEKKKYSRMIDASSMSISELKKHLDDAEIVEFYAGLGKESNDPEIQDDHRVGLAFLKIRDHIELLDISNHIDRIDAHCDKIKFSYGGVEDGSYQKMGWSKSCLSGYEKKYRDKLIFLSNISYGYEWEDKKQAMFMQKFVKNSYQAREKISTSIFLTILNGLTWLVGHPVTGKSLFSGYWLGTAYIQINHYSEVLNFTVPAEYDESNSSHKSTPLGIYDFPGMNESEVRLITSGGDLYVLRKKTGSERNGT